MAENVGIARTPPLMILSSAIGLLLLSSFRSTAADGHARHKRTVSELVDGLMSAMYFHAVQDPLPLPSTVIARITHLPATKMTTRVYKYVPVQTLKLSKLRARQITDPLRLKPKYPKKYSIKTEDSSVTLVKNDLPWTLHPLPPPLPTSKTSIKFEVEKAMPWALHPLPPPVKTKNYSDYYWPDAKKRPKIVYRYKSPMKPYRFVKNYKYTAGFKPSAVDHNSENVGYKTADDRPIVDKPDEYNHVNYKHVDYKHIDYKSPDYNSEHPAHMRDEDDDEHVDEDHRSHHHHGYSHDDHSSDEIEESPSPSSEPPATTEYVSHITIEPSIQIASFSETELQGDGSVRESVSHADSGKQGCRCTVNGHRHKRDAGDPQPRNGNGTADNSITTTAGVVRTRDSVAGRPLRNSYVTPNVGHATDVQIIRSHDITDRTVMNSPVDYVQQVRNLNSPAGAAEVARQPAGANPVTAVKADAAFRDESDNFKVDFGRDESAIAGRGPRFSSINSDKDDDGGLAYGTEPSRGRGYHITKSKVENSDRGVAFSVQTPFSVSSFSSNLRLPETDERRSQFRYTEHKTTSSPLLSTFQSADPHSEQPLDFEQFGLQSALFDDKPLSSDSSRLQTDNRFSNGFDDKPSETVGLLTSGFSDSFSGYTPSDSFGGSSTPSDFSGRFASHFSQGFGGRDNDRSRTKPFRYEATRLGDKSSPLQDRFNGRRPLGGGRASSEDSILEYFQPVVIDFEKLKSNKNDFRSFGNNQNNDKSRFFGKTDSPGFSRFKNNQNSDQLRLPGRLHESNENLSRKMVFHPSTFDID